MTFLDDEDSVSGRTSLRFTPDPYPGLYATAVFPVARDAAWDFSTSREIRFWIKAINPNLPGFQNAGPVVWLYGKGGTLKLVPVQDGHLLSKPPFSEARWTWMPVRIPLSGDTEWARVQSGEFDMKHVTAIGLSLDSWGGDPFTVWVDGLTVE